MSKSNQQQFFAHIIQWQQSGLSQKAWCEQNNISYSTFHYWYRKFRNQQTGVHPNKPDEFVQLFVQDRPAGTPWCELVLGNSKRLVFHHPVAVEFISILLN